MGASAQSWQQDPYYRNDPYYHRGGYSQQGYSYGRNQQVLSAQVCDQGGWSGLRIVSPE